MEVNRIKVKNRQSCPYCFRVIDSDDPDKSLRAFVQCNKCGSIYHTQCWELVTNCVNRVDDGYACNADMIESVIVTSSPKILRARTLKPIRFHGLQPADSQAESTQSQEDESPASESQSPIASSTWRSVLRPRHFVLRVASGILAMILLVGTTQFINRPVNANILSNYIETTPQVIPYVIAGGLVIAFAVIIRQLTRRNPNFFLSSVIPIVISVILISGIFVFTPMMSRFQTPETILDRLPSLITLITIGYGVVYTLAIYAGSFQQHVLLRMIVSSLVAMGLSLVHAIYFNYLDFLPNSAIIIRALIFGIVPWLPGILIMEPGLSRAYERYSWNDDLDTSPRWRGIILRTLALAMLLGVAFIEILESVLPFRRITDDQQVALIVVPALVFAYFVNNFIVEATLRNDYIESYWSRLWRAFFIGGIASIIGAIIYLFAMQELVSSLPDYGSLSDFSGVDAFWDVTNTNILLLGLAGIYVSVVMTISAASGDTRRNKIFYPFIPLFVFHFVIVVMAYALQYNLTNETDILDFGQLFVGSALASITAILCTIPIWFADWIGKRGYNP